MDITLSKKVQAGLASIVLATAATVAPVVAHAAPGLPFAQDEGGSSGSSGGSGKGNSNGTGHSGRPGSSSSSSGGSGSGSAPAAAAPTTAPATAGTPKAAATPKATENPVQNFINNTVKVVVQIAGTVTYGFLDTTAGVLHLTGEYLSTIPIVGPAIGNVFVVIADATQKAAYAVAQATKVGPYSTTG